MKSALTGFDHAANNLVPVIPLSPTVDDPEHCSDVYIAELFHGPTFCFKDFGMRATIYMLDYFAKKRNGNVILVVSTTGDTGPAAVKAVEDCQSDRLGILVHYPEGQISDFQRKQMTTANSSRVKIVAFQGDGDDMDIPIKNIMTNKSKQRASSPDDGKTTERIICGVNSYNIGRPLMQMVHFIWTYLRVLEHVQRKKGVDASNDFHLDVIIPTGAMGNLAGCYMAKNMGIPFGKLCAAVNVNDITDTVFRTGVIQRATEPMKKTLSDAINIQLPYNMERLLFYLTNEDHRQVREWYTRLEGPERCCEIQKSNWWNKMQSEFCSERITDEDLCETMRSIRNKYRYWVDPHTGVALAAARRLGYVGSSETNSISSDNSRTSTTPVAIFATAAPCKFQFAVTTALGKDAWDEYESKHFPTRGKYLDDLEEQPPSLYSADPSKTLPENQLIWEANAWEIINLLGR
jgi:threonine synthase